MTCTVRVPRPQRNQDTNLDETITYEKDTSDKDDLDLVAVQLLNAMLTQEQY